MSELKEKRNNLFWYIHISLSILIWIIFTLITDKVKGVLIAVFFQFVMVAYRILTFCFNSFLRKIIKKRWKINRLKGRVTPIYKVDTFQEISNYFEVTKYQVEYTDLKLAWSVPFSVLFLEQEYIKQKTYKFEYIPMEDIERLWEEKHEKREAKISAEKLKEQQKKDKLNQLNKVFNENYK